MVNLTQAQMPFFFYKIFTGRYEVIEFEKVTREKNNTAIHHIFKHKLHKCENSLSLKEKKNRPYLWHAPVTSF